MEENDGMCLKNSFLTFSDQLVVDNVKGIGISLGEDNRSVHSSISLVKKIELDRFHFPMANTGQDSHSVFHYKTPHYR